MKHKLILLALVFSLVIVSQSSLSLGMGKVQVNSALDEPLNAKINIMANESEPIEQVSVALASSADYKKVGLDKSFVPGNILVSVDQDNPYQINVTSNGPVSEPIVSLLLDVTWPNGRILREFTLLLDPPTYQASSTGSVDMPTVTQYEEPANRESSMVEEPVPSETQTAQSDDIPPVSADLNKMQEAMADSSATEMADDTDADSGSGSMAMSGQSQGDVYVNAGDTLWRIANQNRAGDASTQQMMLAIFKGNPQAFLNNNMNEMVKGSTLTLPSADDAEAISYREALAESKAQHDSWAAKQDNYSSYQTEADDSVSEPVVETPDYGVQLSGGEGNETDSEQTDGDEVAAGSEEVNEVDAYNVASENEELKSRVSELETIVNDQQSVMELEDDDLANLETQLSEAEQPDNLTEGGFDNVDDSVDVTNDTDDGLDSDSDQYADADSNGDDEAMVDDVWDNQDENNSLDNSDATTDESDAMADVTDDNGMADEVSDINEDAGDDTTDESTDVAITPPTKPVRPANQPWYTQAINWVQNNILWVIIGLVVLLALVFLPRLFNRDNEEAAEGGSFLDDIKSTRRKGTPAADENLEEGDDLDEDEETILTRPVNADDELGDDDLQDASLTDEDDDSDDEEIDFDSLADDDDSDEDDDVLANLDSSLKFDDSSAEQDDADEDTFNFDFDDDDEDESELSEETNDQDEKDDDMTGETPTKEFDPAPFKDMDDDSDDGDFSLDSDDSADEDESTEDSLEDDLGDDFDESFELESELDDLDDDEDEDDVDAVDLADDLADDKQQSSLDDDDDFLSELDELEDSDDDDSDEDDSEDTDANDDSFDDVLSLDEDDEDTATFNAVEDEEMDDDSIDLGLDDLMEEGDVIETKLDLAKAYIEMGDTEGAKNLLGEVVSEGSDAQVDTAQKLLDDM